MKSLAVILLAAATLALVPGAGRAGQTIYVNGSGTSYIDPEGGLWGPGNDSNPGTREAPLATVGAATSKIRQSGSTVIIAPGLYQGVGNRISVPSYSGVTYRASDPASKPTIDGTATGKPGVSIDSNTPQARIENIKVVDVSTWGCPAVAVHGSGATLEGLEVSGSAFRTLEISGWSHQFSGSGATNFLIENCRFLAPRPGASGHIVIGGIASGTFSNCLIDGDNNAPYAVINTCSNQINIRNSIVTGGGTSGIVLNSPSGSMTLDSITCFANGMRSSDRFAVENLNAAGTLRVYNSLVNSSSAFDPLNKTLYQADVDSANRKNVNPRFRQYKVGTGIVTISFDDNGDIGLWNDLAAAASSRGVHLTFLIHERTWKKEMRNDSCLVAWKNAGHDVAAHTYSHSYYNVVGQPALSLRYQGPGHTAVAMIAEGRLVTEVDGQRDLDIDLAEYAGYETPAGRHISDLVSFINQHSGYHAGFNPAGLTGLTWYLKGTSLADMPPEDIEDDDADLLIDKNRFFRDEISDVVSWLEGAAGSGYHVISAAAPATVMTTEAKTYMIDSTGIQICRGRQDNAQDNLLLRAVDLYQVLSVPATLMVGQRTEAEIKQAARAIGAAAVEQGGLYGVFGHSSEFLSGQQLGWFIDGLMEFAPKGLKILSMREASDFIRNPANGWIYMEDGVFVRTFEDNSDYGLEPSSPIDSFPDVEFPTRRDVAGEEIAESRADAHVPDQVIGRFSAGAIAIPESVTCGTVADIQDPDLLRLAGRFGVSSIRRMYRSARREEPAVVSRTGGTFTPLNVWDVYLLDLQTGRDVWEAVDSLRQIACCVYAEPNGLLEACRVPTNFLFGSQWDLSRINITGAWDLQTGSPSIRIGVLDTGIDWANPAFGGIAGPCQKVRGGWNYVTGDSIIMDDASGTFDSHGTLVAGVIGACTNSDGGIAGIAGGWGPENLGCPLYALKVGDGEGRFRLDAVCNAIREAWPVFQTDVLNASFGGHDYYESLREALWDAHRMEVVFVAAEGNDDSAAPYFPSDYDRDWVISVGASDDAIDNPPNLHESRVAGSLGHGWGSNYGGGIDVVAPGVSIESSARSGGTSLYKAVDGTSMSAAHVSGLAGLVLSQEPDLCADDVEGVISASAKDLVTDPVGGTNLVGYDQWSGYGRIVADTTLIALGAPYQWERLFLAGGQAVSHTGYIDLVFSGDGPLEGRYFGKRYDVRTQVTCSACPGGVPWVWARGLGASTGWSAATPNYQAGFARVVESSRTETGCELQSFVYEVWTAQGDYLGWYPCRPEEVVFGYTVLGRCDGTSGVTPGERTVAELRLAPKHNPCRGHTVLALELPSFGTVDLSIYDIRGRKVRTLFEGKADSGRHEIAWDAQDSSGRPVAPGLYFCRLQAAGKLLTARIVVIR